MSLARDVVRDVLRGSALAELEDEASLLVSEIVTNAVLHAGSHVEVSCAIDGATLCVRVRDRSPVVPSVRHYDEEAMTGRGLGLVELLASAWGVDRDAGGGGKAVWFELVDSCTRARKLPAHPLQEEFADTEAWFTLRLRNSPAALLATTVQYGDTLLRELTLSAIADDAAVESPSWHVSHVDLGPVLDAIQRAGEGAADPVDVDIAMPTGSGAAAFKRSSLIEEANRMALEGRLLTTAELPEVAACRHWLLGEIGSQEGGGQPVPWQLPDPLPAARPPKVLRAAERARLEQRGTAVVVADAANQILYVNAEAGTLLGWPPDELAGRRLITIVPQELREAHLAGFGRFLLTGEPRLLDKRVVLPALRRDGTRVDVAVLITLLDTEGDPLTFLAELSEPQVQEH